MKKSHDISDPEELAELRQELLECENIPDKHAFKLQLRSKSYAHNSVRSLFLAWQILKRQRSEDLNPARVDVDAGDMGMAIKVRDADAAANFGVAPAAAAAEVAAAAVAAAAAAAVTSGADGSRHEAAPGADAEAVHDVTEAHAKIGIPVVHNGSASTATADKSAGTHPISQLRRGSAARTAVEDSVTREQPESECSPTGPQPNSAPGTVNDDAQAQHSESERVVRCSPSPPSAQAQCSGTNNANDSGNEHGSSGRLTCHTANSLEQSSSPSRGEASRPAQGNAVHDDHDASGSDLDHSASGSQYAHVGHECDHMATGSDPDHMADGSGQHHHHTATGSEQVHHQTAVASSHDDVHMTDNSGQDQHHSCGAAEVKADPKRRKLGNALQVDMHYAPGGNSANQEQASEQAFAFYTKVRAIRRVCNFYICTSHAVKFKKKGNKQTTSPARHQLMSAYMSYISDSLCLL